jgi:RNA polymerase sigma-70 factor, ECF subfamily
MTEAEKLIKKIINQDQKAVKQFYSNHQERLRNYIIGRIDDPEDAEEILQDTFVSTINSLPSFNFKSSLSSFLFAIARHEIADFYRKRKIKTILFSKFPFLETVADKALTPEEKALKQELKEEIKLVMDQLKPRYSQILRLKYYYNHSVKEIAKKLKSTPKAIESTLSRARKSFKKNWLVEGV